MATRSRKLDQPDARPDMTQLLPCFDGTSIEVVQKFESVV